MEVIIVTTHLRNAAGACALSIGLLVCSSGGAIAFADQTDADSATAGSLDDTTTGDATTTDTSTGPTSTVGSQPTDTDAVEDKVTTVGTEKTTTSVTIGNGPTSTIQAQTNTSTKTEEDPDLVTIAVTELDKVGIMPGAILETSPTQAVTPSAVEFQPPSGSNSGAGSAKLAESDDYAPAPLAAPAEKTFATGLTGRGPDPLSNAVIVPVSNAIVTLARGLGQGAFTLAQLPTSATPVTDVIEALSLMVGGVIGAVVEVSRVPGNLITLLAANPASVQPPPIGASRTVVSTVRTPVDLMLGPGVSQAQPPIATAGAPLFGTAIYAAAAGSAPATSLKNQLSLSGLAPVPSGVSPATTSFLDHVVRSVLVPASLTALAAIAVPGLGGLLIVCAAGVRVGYRQAKAGLALRASGIARFAGPGPMGVVRSGSLIALHTRTPKFAKTPAVKGKSATGPRLLESVA
ncbi:hypothetical protein [Mycolicibacterium gadium]|uniref:Uncharacterized protein n=1 Tax=Mycolicibacterium gadium TaxID=1794 RepID=A0A7I7WME2_MYCGU|nr:hypothetical protein [Mycolicibacterium gadium]BBZ17673.1 hypothetical protein MGAD_20080 [Mycolicibacterium gadium]